MGNVRLGELTSLRPSCMSFGEIPRSKRSLGGPISRDIAIVSLQYPLSRDTF